jgi:hypothetical protein
MLFNGHGQVLSQLMPNTPLNSALRAAAHAALINLHVN